MLVLEQGSIESLELHRILYTFHSILGITYLYVFINNNYASLNIL